MQSKLHVEIQKGIMIDVCSTFRFTKLLDELKNILMFLDILFDAISFASEDMHASSNLNSRVFVQWRQILNDLRPNMVKAARKCGLSIIAMKHGISVCN